MATATTQHIEAQPVQESRTVLMNSALTDDTAGSSRGRMVVAPDFDFEVKNWSDKLYVYKDQSYIYIYDKSR